MLAQLSLFTSLAVIINAAATRRSTCPDGIHTAENPTCCPWYSIRDDLQSTLFHNQCQGEAHETLRATFHDAIGISAALTAAGQFGGGGADGSLIAFGPSTEFSFAPNIGLEDISLELKTFADKWNVSYGDIIQFAGAVGITNCAGAPTIQTFVGRPNAVAASPPGLVPDPTQDVATLVNRFNDAGISTANMVWLLNAHSVGAQDFVDPQVAGSPFDSTPSQFDVQFYLEVLLQGEDMSTNVTSGEVMSPLQGEFRLQSDFALSRDTSQGITCLWQLPLSDPQPNFTFINNVFSLAMTDMSLNGQDQSTLTDCTEVIPTSQPLAKAPTYPAGKSASDLQLPTNISCGLAIPSLATDPGPATTVAPVPIPTFTPAS